MWAYDFFRADPAARSLKTHVRANNFVLRCWSPEYYLPEEMRLGFLGRTVRLFCTLMIQLMIVSIFVGSADAEYYKDCKIRQKCKRGCTLDFFPEMPCHETRHVISYGGNDYEHLFRYRKKDNQDPVFDECAGTVPQDIKGSAEVNARQLHDERLPKTHVCFNYCHKVSMTPEEKANQYYDGVDTRSMCASADEELDLLCVDSEDECEKTRFKTEYCIPGLPDFCFNIYVLLASCLLSIPIQFVFDLAFIYSSSIRVESVHEVKKTVQKCTMEWFICICIVILAIHASASIAHLYFHGRPNMMWLTWVLVVALDLVRNIIVQAIVWYVLLRRCGQVPLLNEDEAYRPDDDEEEEKPNPFQVVQQLVNQLVEAKQFDLVIYACVGVYAVFILLWLAIEEHLSPEDQKILDDIDTVFLIIFLVEIFLRTVAHGRWYVFDIWNIFDAAIVITSAVFKIAQQANRSVTLLRLLRLLRLVLVLRKVNATKKRPPPQQGNGLNFSSPVERVLDTFEDIKNTKGVSASLRERLDWAAEIISSNKLYAINVEADKSKGDGQMVLEQEVQDWVQMASEVTEKSSILDNELEKFLMGKTKKRSCDELQEQAADIMHAEVEEACNIQAEFEKKSRFSDAQDRPAENKNPNGKNPRPPARQNKTANGGLDEPDKPPKDVVEHYLAENMGKWEFDIWHMKKLCGPDRLLSIITMQAFLNHELFSHLEINGEDLHLYLVEVTKGYYVQNPFHNATHAADVVQSLYCLIDWLNADHPESPVVAGQDLLSSLLAAAVHDYEHPGFNNQFLVRTKHKMAIRYNDNSILENHHVAAAFALMLSMKSDPLANLTESQYSHVRRRMIAMVLATDIGLHFTELSFFKTKMNSKDFLTGKGENRQTLLNILLHAADISNPSRPDSIYFTWVPLVMEEFFRQGDVEKSQNLPMSMFYDRDGTNIAKCQVGFIDVLVLPLFKAVGALIPVVETRCVKNLSANRTTHAQQNPHDFQPLDEDDHRGKHNGCSAVCSEAVARCIAAKKRYLPQRAKSGEGGKDS